MLIESESQMESSPKLSFLNKRKGKDIDALKFPGTALHVALNFSSLDITIIN